MIRRALLLVLPGIFLSAALFAQEPSRPPSGPAAPPPTPQKKQRWVTLKGGKNSLYRRTETPQGAIQVGTGDLLITSEETRLESKKLTYNEKTQIATSPGALKLEDTYNTLTGNTGTAYYKTRDAKIRGKVVIVARPRTADRNAPSNSARRQFDSPVTIVTEKVDYNWGTQIAVIPEKVTVTMKDYVVTASRAIYDGKKETVVLDGDGQTPVIYRRPNGETGAARRVFVVFTEGKEDFVAQGDVNGTFLVEDEANGTTTPAPTVPAVPELPTVPPTQEVPAADEAPPQNNP